MGCDHKILTTCKKEREALQNPESNHKGNFARFELEDGEHEIIKDLSEFKFPIKVVAVVKEGIVTVITNYPLKKGRKNESLL